MSLIDEVVDYAAKLYREEKYELQNAVSAALDAYHFRGAERQETFRTICRILGSRGGNVAAEHKAQRSQMSFKFEPK